MVTSNEEYVTSVDLEPLTDEELVEAGKQAHAVYGNALALLKARSEQTMDLATQLTALDSAPKRPYTRREKKGETAVNGSAVA